MSHISQPVRPSRPQLRCPACGSLISLPARECPECQADLRTGRRPRKWYRLRLNRCPRIVRRGLKLIVTLGLAAWAWLAIQNYRFAPPPPPTASPGAPDSFQRLAADHPALLRPYVLVYKSRAAVSNYNTQLGNRQEFWQELARTDPNELTEREAYEFSRALSPAQRIRILKELLAIAAGGQSTPDQELHRRMTSDQRERVLDELYRVKPDQSTANTP